MDQTSWVRVFELDRIPVGESRLYKHGNHQVAVFRTADRSCFAIDNLCPHEGYPLLGGPVSDCVVTCPWHNYKFRLDDGACVKGEEDVRSYPLRLVDGHIEVDLSDPDPSLVLARLETSLADGMWRGNLGQVARDLVRWLDVRGRVEDLAQLCVAFDARYAEWGTTHALAVAVDALTLADRREGTDRVLPMLYAFEEASEEQRRREPRPVVPSAPVPEPCWERIRQDLFDLVEAEKAEEAEALLRMLLQQGIGAETIEPWFQELCAQHFLGFGHPLIYTSKAFALLDRVGFEHAEQVLPALLLRIVRATRESLLPEWSRWRKDMAGLQDRMPALWASIRDGEAGDTTTLRAAILDGSSADATGALIEAAASGLSLHSILGALSTAAAERLLRFDTDIEEDPGIQDGWLDVTHRFTFVNAIRNCSQRAGGPWILSLLLQAAHWIQAARPLDESEPDWNRSTIPTSSLDEVFDAIRASDADRALAALRACRCTEDEKCMEALRIRLEELVLSGPAVRPIVSAHLIKTMVAAFQEAGQISGRLADLPLQAFVRLLSSPLVENVLPRRVHEAIGFVIDGKVPKTLT